MRITFLLLLSCLGLWAQPLPIQHRPPVSGNTLLNGLVAAWNFEQNLVGPTNYASDFGGFWWTNNTSGSFAGVGTERGMMGGALVTTNSANSFLTLTNTGVFGLNSSFTMAFWVLGGNGANSHLGQTLQPNASTFDYQYVPGQFQVTDAGNALITLNAVIPSPTVWAFVVVGFDKANNVIFTSVNGGAKSTLLCTSIRQTANMPFRNQYILGVFDNFNFWNRALTAGEITLLYNGGYGLQYPFNNPSIGYNEANAWGWTVTNLGGTVSTTEYNAVKNLVDGFASDGIWSKFGGFVPMTTNGLKSALTPVHNAWKATPGNDAICAVFDAYRGQQNFVDGDVSINGVTGNGSSKYTMFTGLQNTVAGINYMTPNGVNNCGFIIYPYTATSSAHGSEMGYADFTPLAFYYFRVNAEVGNPTNSASIGDANIAVTNGPSPPGFYSVQRTSSTDLSYYYACATNPHSRIDRKTTLNTVDFSRLPNNSPGIWVYWSNTGGFAGANCSPNTLSFVAWLNSALTSSEDALAFNRIEAFRIALGGGMIPPFETTPSNSVVLLGNNKTLVGSASGASAYQWTKNGAAIGGATQSSYTVTGAALSDFGNYSLVATVNGASYPCPAIQLATVTTTTVSNWVVQVGVNGAATMSSNTIWGVDQYWNGIVSAGLDTKILAINPIVPDSLQAALTPLVAGTGNKLWVNHNFVSGDVTVNGIKGDGTTKYADTGIAPSAQFSPTTSAGIFVYNYDIVGGGGTGIDMGGWDAGTGNGIIVAPQRSDGYYGYNGSIAGNAIHSGSQAGNGFYSDQRFSSTDHKLYFASSGSAHAQISATDSTSFSGTQSSSVIFLSATSFGGALNSPTSNTISLAGVSKGLSSGDDSTLYSLSQTLRTTLGGGFR